MVAEQATLDLKAGSLVVATSSRRPDRSGGSTQGLTINPAAESGEARRFSFGNGVRLVYDPPDSK